MAVRSGVGVGMLVLPTLIGLSLDTAVDPLNGMLDALPWGRWVLYPGLLGLGVVLYRLTVRERDHEHRRSTTLHGLRHVFRAEDEGLWESSAPLPVGQHPSALAGERVGVLTKEAPDRETDAEVDVTTVMGQLTTMDGDEVERSVGATMTESPMDRFIDGVQNLFTGDGGAERRAARRRQQLAARAEADPIRAARPIAPLPNDVNENPSVETTSFSTTVPPLLPSGRSCTACGAGVATGERFCPACGSTTP
jgi:hypothetical protein